MSEALNYYKISHYEPYDDSDDIIMGHKSYFTDSELSVMVYCKRENSLLFKKHGCPVKNPRNKTEEEND